MANDITPDLESSALAYHRNPKPGKLEIQATKPLGNQRDLALAYSPAWPSRRMRRKPHR
jgi:malate dehydrogenase (oxaloacetate-decarboxylating)(NADP+)